MADFRWLASRNMSDISLQIGFHILGLTPKIKAVSVVRLSSVMLFEVTL